LKQFCVKGICGGNGDTVAAARFLLALKFTRRLAKKLEKSARAFQCSSSVFNKIPAITLLKI